MAIDLATERRANDNRAERLSLEHFQPWPSSNRNCQAQTCGHIFYLKEWVDAHRVVVLRGFAPLAGPALPEFCQSLGELLEWEFGAVNDLRIKSDTRNYLYTNREVPFHWDGAFIDRAPHYIFFHCDVAPVFWERRRDPLL